MTVGKFIALRKTLGLSQTELAARLGLSLRAVQAIEKGESPLRAIHGLAIERVALAVAVEERQPMKAPTAVRREALQLSQDLVGPV